MAVNTNTLAGIAAASAPKTTKPTAAQTAAANKATKIDAMNDAATTAYQSSLTATPKNPAEIAALNDVVAQTVSAIQGGTALPSAARTGVPAQPNAASTWNGSSWSTPAGATGNGVGTTTARAVLEMYLRDAGIPNDIIPSSISYLEALDEAGIKDQQTLIDLYMNNKTFTAKNGAVLNSPFYQKYTSITDGLVNPATGQPYTAKESFAWRVGMEAKVSQYGFSPLFVTDDNLKKFAKNGVSVSDLETRMQQANLAASAADPNKVAALQKLGFINGNQGVKDFYLNSDIGQKQFEENARVGAFAAENLRYANKGLNFDAARIKQLTDMYGTGTETDAATAANKLYSGVAENLQQTVALTGMYDKTGLTAAQESTGVQTQLENEIALNTPSDMRKRLEETDRNAFLGKAGVSQGALGNRSTAGLI